MTYREFLLKIPDLETELAAAKEQFEPKIPKMPAEENNVLGERSDNVFQAIYDSIKRMDEMAEIRNRLTMREAQMSQEKIHKGDVKS